MLTGERAPPLHHQNGDPLRHSLPPELRRVPAAMPKKTLPRRPRHFAVAKVHLTPEGGRQRARGSAARPSLLQKTRPRHPPPRLEQKCSIQSTKKGTPSKAHSHSRQRQRRQRRWPKPPSPLTGTLAGWWGPPELRQVQKHLPRGPLLCPSCPPAGPLGIPPQRNHRLGYAFESEFA